MPQNDDNVPHFLRRLVPSTKDPYLEWDLPGLTVVPNEVFYKFTTQPNVEEKSMILREKGEDSEIIRKRKRHEELISENFEVGFLFASKPLVQAIANPFVGSISSK